MKRIRTHYVPIYRDDQVIHTATVRSDWLPNDYKALAEMFPGCHVKSVTITCPLDYLGNKDHGTDFNGMHKFATK